MDELGFMRGICSSAWEMVLNGGALVKELGKRMQFNRKAAQRGMNGHGREYWFLAKARPDCDCIALVFELWGLGYSSLIEVRIGGMLGRDYQKLPFYSTHSNCLCLDCVSFQCPLAPLSRALGHCRSRGLHLISLVCLLTFPSAEVSSPENVGDLRVSHRLTSTPTTHHRFASHLPSPFRSLAQTQSRRRLSMSISKILASRSLPTQARSSAVRWL